MAKIKKYHFLYKTTNLENNKFYIGMHSTNNLNDNYLGSGKYILKAIKKYGKHSFERKILGFFDTREQLIEKEKEIVTQELLNNSLCLNFMIGGQGGCSYIWTDEKKKIQSDRMKGPQNPTKGRERTETEKLNISINHANVSGEKNFMYNKNHTLESKQKMSLIRKRKLNEGSITVWNKGCSPEKEKCPHCQTWATKQNLTRWHFEKCKKFIPQF